MAPTFIQTAIYRLRKPAAGNKVNDFAPIVNALADDTDAALGTSIFTSGDLKITAAANPPTGWLVCDGSAVSRSAYAALFAAISTAYGTGDGSSTFNLPDYRGRTIVGAGAGAGLTPRMRGQTFGEEAHHLVQGELPNVTWPKGWTTGMPLGAQSGTGSYAVEAPGGAGFALVQDTDVNVSSGGSDTPHNNVQPSAVATVLIKT